MSKPISYVSVVVPSISLLLATIPMEPNGTVTKLRVLLPIVLPPICISLQVFSLAYTFDQSFQEVFPSELVVNNHSTSSIASTVVGISGTIPATPLLTLLTFKVIS
jgi:hypothetical protein